MNNSSSTFISVENVINAPIQRVWDMYTGEEHVTQWNFADSSWECSYAKNDLQEGGKFVYTMRAKDGSAGFDFSGTYNEILEMERIDYTLDDGRNVTVYFEELDEETTHITVDFEAESSNQIEIQESGWQNILNNFREYVEKITQ